MPIKCFFLEPTDKVARYLRRFEKYDQKGSCTPKGGVHDAMTRIEDTPVDLDACGTYRVGGDDWPHDDPRWPKACERCGQHFNDDDHWQLFQQRLFRRSDTGELVTLRDAHPGAMWFAPWMESYCKGFDGRCLVVKLPGDHDWLVDSRASNCTLPNDTEHRCWIRHGEPPSITVDKNGRTCNAGAGSIAIAGYHGFLRDGYLT